MNDRDDFLPEVRNKAWKTIFSYENGVLIWKVGQRKDKQAGTINGSGYTVFKHEKKIYLVHRVVFEMHWGIVPNRIDHINGNRSDNRIENLRQCTASENQSNQKKSVKNTSSVKDVFWTPKVSKWRVRVQFDKHRKDFGYYKELDTATLVAKQAREQMHKEFACHE